MLGHQSPSSLLDDSLPTISLEDHTLYNSNQTQTHSHSPAPSGSPPYHFDDFQPSPSNSILNLPGTPSYAGSYNGSPNSNWGDADEGLILYTEQHDEYNPSEYDIVDNTASMYGAHPDTSPFDLIDENFDFGNQASRNNNSNPTVSVVPADTLSNDSQLAISHASPASSAGIPNDPRSPSPMRSRASSIASSHGSPNNSRYTDNNNVSEPQWGVTAPSPPANAPSPNHGSRSPPTLLIPDTSNQPGNHLNVGGLYPLGVNGNADSRGNGSGLAPDGPGINLIPATPVSGGGNGATTAPFPHAFNRAETPQRQASRGPSPVPTTANNPGIDVHMWASQPMDRNPNIRVPSPAHSPAMQPQFLNSNNNRMAEGNVGVFNGGAISSNPSSPFIAPSPSVSPHPSPIPGMLDLAGFGGGGTAGQSSLAVPAYMKHQRSKSETYSQAQRPTWALGVNTYQPSSANLPHPFSFDHQQQQNINSSNMQQMNHNVSYMQPQHPSSADALNPNFPRMDPPQMNHATSFGPGITPGFNMGGDMYLNTDPAAIRRARSDAGFGHRRSAKSEDYSRSPQFGGSLNPGLTVDQAGMLVPPNHPSLMVPGEYGRPRGNGGMGHHRRTSSGSRGSVSGASSARASPYPSPNASPMVDFAQLQPDMSGGMNDMNMDALNLREGTNPSNIQLNVARPHVTTTATQAASATRRTSEATFTCPVPGCGSTFTRHFNLKGHLRSHNDERPFKCKWPGCEKGFARQHDCKRHEQLHLNIRPYTCEGCSRTFARMDALNRHLRSEGGAECAKHQQPLTEERLPPKQDESIQQPWMNSGSRSGAVLT